MNSKEHISIHQFTEAYADVSEDYFRKLEGKILSQTVARSELKAQLLLFLHSKPIGFEIVHTDLNYFDALAQTIVNQTSTVISNQIWLGEKQEIGFQIPDQYFDTLSNRIKTKLPKQKTNQWEWLPNLIEKPAFYLAAAMICFTIGFGYLKLTDFNNSADMGLALETLTKEEISTYIASNSDKIDLNNIPDGNWEKELSHHELSETDVNDLIITDEL